MLPPVEPPPAPETEAAKRLFQEAERLSRQDDGKLWRLYLEGPMLVVDPRFRLGWANQAFPGWTRAARMLWAGEIGQRVLEPVLQVEGKAWAVAELPAPADPLQRSRWLTRLLFRRLEGALGLPSNRPRPSHLATPEAARWMMLEAAALRRALAGSGASQRAALEDALVFRVWRRAEFKLWSNRERVLELNDGLAEYTAVVLTVKDEPARREEAFRMLSRLDPVRFAPAFGLAYGLLMDQRSKRWRELLDPEVDLALVLREVWSLAPALVSREEAERRAGFYRGAE